MNKQYEQSAESIARLWADSQTIDFARLALSIYDGTPKSKNSSGRVIIDILLKMLENEGK